MQKNYRKKIIEQARDVNPHWYQVDVWRDGEIRVPRSVPTYNAYRFIEKDPGTQRAVMITPAPQLKATFDGLVTYRLPQHRTAFEFDHALIDALHPNWLPTVLESVV